MTLRKVPGALVLGLLASLVAHAALYGAEHAMAGGYHALLVQAAIAGAIGFLMTFGAIAWSAAGSIPDGSVLAARLTERLPDFAVVGATAAGWLALAEAVEPHHASAPAVVMVACLVLASWLVQRFARSIVEALASLAIAISRPAFTPRTPSWTRHRPASPLARRAPCARRRFARPPPTAATVRA